MVKINCCKLELVLLLFLIFPRLGYLSPYLPTYDIWDDAESGKTSRLSKNLPERSSIFPKQQHHSKGFGNKTRRGKILPVFQLFSYPEEKECQAQDGRRVGLCMNTYSCHQQGGKSSGSCARGFGVCCVFVATCGQAVHKNLTYLVSPEFPSLSRNLPGCNMVVKKMEGISQLRLDFLHFNLGQPNRLTGDCDSDVFIMSGGSNKDFKLCGQNSGQHIYYNIDKAVDMVSIDVRLMRPVLQRLWEIRVTQVPFAQRAPDGCLQYHTTSKGVIETLNFAENGRHLADQDYLACVRQSRGMCSIAYEPCDEDSFRIGPSSALAEQTGMAFNSGSYFPGSPGSFGGAGSEGFLAMGAPQATQTGAASQLDETAAEGDGSDMLDVGSGDGAAPATSIMGNFMMMGRQFSQWSPYAQHLAGQLQSVSDPQLWRYWGYGNYGQGVSSFGKQRCQDRIVTPCDGDEFIGTNAFSPGSCDPFHCGFSLCPEFSSRRRMDLGAISHGRQSPRSSCRLETSATPFTVGVRFGPPAPKPSPEDNIGVCLRFEQVPCAS